jgi:hypothetical protein
MMIIAVNCIPQQEQITKVYYIFKFFNKLIRRPISLFQNKDSISSNFDQDMLEPLNRYIKSGK